MKGGAARFGGLNSLGTYARPVTIRLRPASALAFAGTILLLAGCGTPAEQEAAPAASASSSTPIPTTAPPKSDSAGLVAAVHPQCNAGQKILRYLADGNNQGDPQLDERFSQYVGVPAPQARGIADQYIQQCDAAFSKQEANQASAAAKAEADASASAAAAVEASQQAQEQQQIQANKESSCAAIGGRIDGDMCRSTVQGSPGGPGLDCSYASITISTNGTIDPAAIADLKSQLPGCFK